jgi:hypothetical protein
MSEVTEIHEEKETLQVDIELPGHEARGSASALFERTRSLLLARDKVCWVCGIEGTKEAPLEAHHSGIERSFATAAIDWITVRKDFPDFNWDEFDTSDPLSFVDNMVAQGLLLCAEHHRGKNAGIHYLPWPLFVIQRYLKSGYKFSDTEVIEHTEYSLPIP